MTMPNSEEEAIQKAQQYDLRYAQSGYLYTILPDAPRSRSGDLSAPGASHAADCLIGYILPNHPYWN
jgi:hypothetical protein